MEKVRKFIWILIFVGILLNGAVVLFPKVPQKEKQTASIWAIFQGLYCYMTFDRVWGKKEEDEENENV